mgnify:CR=1 FL=1
MGIAIVRKMGRITTTVVMPDRTISLGEEANVSTVPNIPCNKIGAHVVKIVINLGISEKNAHRIEEIAKISTK